MNYDEYDIDALHRKLFRYADPLFVVWEMDRNLRCEDASCGLDRRGGIGNSKWWRVLHLTRNLLAHAVLLGEGEQTVLLNTIAENLRALHLLCDIDLADKSAFQGVNSDNATYYSESWIPLGGDLDELAKKFEKVKITEMRTEFDNDFKTSPTVPEWFVTAVRHLSASRDVPWQKKLKTRESQLRK